MGERDQFSEFDVDAPQGAEPHDREEVQDRDEDTGDMVPRSRLDEIRAQRDQLHAQREEMIRSMLSGNQAAEGGEQRRDPEPDDLLKPEIPEGTDPEVAQLLGPILEANNRALYDRVSRSFEQRVAPVEERINFADMVENVSSRVEGFNEVRGDIVRMLEQMDPVERDRYSDETGLEALAYRALRDRGDRMGSRADMAHTAPFGASEGRATRRKATEADVWAMSDAEFERELERKGLSL